MKGLPATAAMALAGHHADHHPADQPRPAGGGDAGEIAEAQARLRHHPADQGIEMVEMAAGGDLRHHPAIGPVLGELRQHRLGQHAPVVGHQCRRRLVAARLDAQHDHVRRR